MPTAIGYFFYPFAFAGDTTPINVDTQPSILSYQQGYGPDYERNLLTDPLAQPIGRLTMNQLFFEICTQLQQYSQFGVPAWITSSQNQGTPYAYAIYARVRYTDTFVYESQVASNTSVPGTDANWLRISGDSTGVLPGTILDFGGITVPAGYLGCDGSAVLRTTYATLLAAISQTQTGTTTNTLFTVSGLTSTANMYVGMDLESANFPAGTTVASIVDANNITTSAAATASSAVSIHFFLWGNGDGSTTFNVPDLTRKTTIGAGGTPYGGTTAGQVNSASVGFATGGQEAHTPTLAETFSHTHAQDGSTVLVSAGIQTFVAGGPPAYGTGGTTAASGSSTPFNVMQPSAIVTKIIKF